jgi:uncharacterized protein (TIGR03067 family)
MKHFLLTLAALAASLSVFASDQADDAKAIQGTWLPTKAEIAGKPMGNDFITTTTLKLDNGKYEVIVAGQPDNGAYTIDPAQKPKTIDITGTEGPNIGKKIPAIYELRGDTLRICYGLGGSPRPTEFKSPTNTSYFLVTYKREKVK